MGNKMKKKLGMSAVLVFVLVAAMLTTSISAFAYTLDKEQYRVDNSGTAETLNIVVTGAMTNQITVVVRDVVADEEDESETWLDNPEKYVLFIDQVKGTGENSNVKLGFDKKWTNTLDTTKIYKIFVGGTGQAVEEAELRFYSIGAQMPKPNAPGGVANGATYEAPVTLTYDGDTVNFTEVLYLNDQPAVSDTVSTDGTYEAFVRRTATSGGIYKDSEQTVLDSDKVIFTMAAEAPLTLIEKINALLENSDPTAAEIAKLKAEILPGFEALSTSQKAVVNAATFSDGENDYTYAQAIDKLEDVRTAHFDTALATVKDMIDELPTLAEIEDLDPTEKEAKLDEAKLILDAIDLIAADYDGDTAAASALKAIAGAYKQNDTGDTFDEIYEALGGDTTPKPVNPVITPIPGTTTSAVTFELPNDAYLNGNYTIDGVQVFYSTELGKYVANIPNASITEGTFALTAGTGTTPTFLYGDFDDNDKITSNDLGKLTEYIEADVPLDILLAADLDGNGRVNSNDLGFMTERIEVETKFPVLP